MLDSISTKLFSKSFPLWFRILNLAILLPILIWPIVFYTTIFLFDNPKNWGLTFLSFVAINAYPIYLILITYFNGLLFLKNNFWGSLIPSLVLISLTFCVVNIIYEMRETTIESKERENERKRQGYIGANNDYRIINNKVYYKDSLIKGADAKTFEIVSWNWQRDKNHYYYFGKKVQYIDRRSFQDLDYHYGKDDKHVYYDEKIIEGADSKTFIHIEGTQEGRDANNCYSWGKKVGCEILKANE